MTMYMVSVFVNALLVIALVAFTSHRYRNGLTPFAKRYLLGGQRVIELAKKSQALGVVPLVIALSLHIAGYVWFDMAPNPNSGHGPLSPSAYTDAQCLLIGAASWMYVEAIFSILGGRRVQARPLSEPKPTIFGVSPVQLVMLLAGATVALVVLPGLFKFATFAAVFVAWRRMRNAASHANNAALRPWQN